MGRPGAIVTRMNSHGWIFCGADSVCYRVCRFQQNSTRNRLLLPGLSWMAGAGDPVATSLVESLARPGGNFIGASSGGAEVAGMSLPPLTLTR